VLRNLAAEVSSLQSALAPKRIGSIGVRSLDACALTWTTPSTNKASLSKKNTPGTDGSMKSAVM